MKEERLLRPYWIRSPLPGRGLRRRSSKTRNCLSKDTREGTREVGE